MDFIIFVIIIAALVLSIMVFIWRKKIAKQRIISYACSECKNQIAVLLNRDAFNGEKSLSKEDKEKIASLSIEEWSKWKTKIRDANVIAKEHSYIFDSYIHDVFPHLQSKRYPEKPLFNTANKRNEMLIQCMTVPELDLVLAESQESWNRRTTQHNKAAEIKRNNKEGYKTYCEVHNIPMPSDIDVIRDRISIAGFQESYNRSILYNGWGEKQMAFCDEFYNLCKKHRENDGRYSYKIKYSRITREGKTSSSEFLVWQGFVNSFSFGREDFLTENMKQNRENISEFREKKRYYNYRIHDNIFELIRSVSDLYDGHLLVIFVNSSRYSWVKSTYDYHYKRLRRKLNENNITYCDFENLFDTNADSVYSVAIIVDFITNIDDLKNNCKIVAEVFNKNIPYIGYYTYLKEYTAEEVEYLYNKRNSNNNL